MARQRRQSAGKYRSARPENRGSRRAQPHDPDLCTRPDEARRLCPAGSALERPSRRERRGPAAMAKRKMGVAARQSFSRTGRLPHWLPPAVVIAALGSPCRLSIHRGARLTRRARCPAGTLGNPATLRERDGARSEAGAHRTGGDRGHRAHGAFGRAARWCPLCLHAASEDAGRLP